MDLAECLAEGKQTFTAPNGREYALAWPCPACGTVQKAGPGGILVSHALPRPEFDPGAPKCSHGIPKPRYRLCPGSGCTTSWGDFNAARLTEI